MSKSKNLQSLRVAVLLIAGAVLVIFAILFFSIFYITMPGMLLQTETQYLQNQLTVVDGLMEDAAENAELMVEDVGVWDETAKYIEGENPGYFDIHWSGTSLLESYQFNFIMIKDLAGNDVFYDTYDFVSGENLALPDGLSAHLNRYAALALAFYHDPESLVAEPTDAIVSGLTFYDEQPYYFSLIPVVEHAASRTPVGVVILGNALTNDYFRHLTHFDAVTFEMLPGRVQPTSPTGSIHTLTGQADENINRIDAELVSTTLNLEDVDGNPATLYMSAPREIYGSGLRSITQTMVLLMVCVVLFAGSFYLIVVRMILNPVERLSGDIEDIARQGYVAPEKYSDSSEFVTLCNAINDMLNGLRQSNISLSAFKTILDGMDAYIYVSDADTDEILFINESMRRHYELGDDWRGQTCWKLLQKEQPARCTFCPVGQLQNTPDEAVVWEEQSTLTGRSYRNTDRLIEWVDGRQAHLQLSVDITDAKQTEVILKRRLEQQELMTAMAQSFIAPDDKGTLINHALMMAGRFMDVSKIVMGRYDEEANTLHFEYEWYSPEGDVPRLVTRDHHLDASDPILSVMDGLREGYYACSDVTALPELAYLTQGGIRALLAVPLYVSGMFWGLISFDDCRGTRAWSESEIQLVKLIASVISGVVTRSATEENLVRMSSIVNSSPQYITYVSPTGELEYFNPAVSKISGYTPVELAAGGLGLLFGEATTRLIMEEHIPAVLQGKKNQFELELICKNGERRVLVLSVFTTSMEKLGVAAIGNDVTEQRQLERDLVAAKEQAEQSSYAKGNFLSRMSHEMRTPMNAIIGMTNIAKGTGDAERKDYCLDKIDEASTHLLGVINDILDVSKIEAGKFELSVSEFDFEKMLLRVTNVMNFRIDEKKQNFIVKVGPQVPRVLISDEQRFAQVLTNLLSNAVKFTSDHGTITLDVQNLETDGDEHLLQVLVRDTGIGISAEQQTRLFRNFEQADGGIARKFGGTGLGLAISKSIVELMGGDIWIESEPGVGTTVFFKVPVKRGNGRPESLLHPAINWQDLRLLAVDDAPEVLEYFQEITQSLKLNCHVAAGGAEAFEMIEARGEEPYNLIFVDWRMPDMNGIELAREIKNRYGEHTIVIMISAAEWSEIEAEAHAAGVDGFIPKPLFSSLIVNCINEYLGPATPVPEAGAVKADENCFAGRHILLVEDIEINREIVLAMLEHTGAQIDTAENGIEAVRAVEANPDAWDIILMDIHMPEMDGYEATRRIRALNNPHAQRVPIVAMTANVFREDIERCLAAGMNDHIGKPIDFDEIMAKLERQFATPNGEDDNREGPIV